MELQKDITNMNRARCLLAEGKIAKSYWPECIYTAAYIGNRLIANTKNPLMRYFLIKNRIYLTFIWKYFLY